MNDEIKKLIEMLEKHENEIAYSVQEWGIKNNLRLFGYDLHPAMDRPAKGKAHGDVVPTARAYFTDTGFKDFQLLYFSVKEKGGKVSITQDKVGFKYPIKFCKTHEFISERIAPVDPIYGLLVDKDIILPFQSTMKNKEWQALPFIEIGNIKAINLFEKKADYEK
jgi:hypothetical protein